MLRNHLKLILRRLIRERLYTIVNLVGLTTGLAATILIALYVKDELSYDTFHKSSDDIYRLVKTNKQRGNRSGLVVSDFAQLISDKLPEVEGFVRLSSPEAKNLLQTEGIGIYEKRVYFSDRNFFEVFDFKLLSGSKESVLEKPLNAVITERLAQRLFGDLDPIGRTVKLNKEYEVVVSGLAENPPLNSTIQFELLVSSPVDFMANDFSKGYVRNNLTYFKTIAGADIKGLVEKINKEKDEVEYAVILRNVVFSLLPLKHQRLRAEIRDDFYAYGDINSVVLFSGIGLVILVLAIINYVNMVTAQSLKRAKEIGLRKVIGANNRQMLSHQLLESVLISFLALVIAFGLAERILPFLNHRLNKEIQLDYISLEFFLFLPLMALALGFLSAIYPSFFIQRFKALSILKQGNETYAKSKMRQALTTFQFFAAMVLIVITVVMQSQMNFLHNKDLGFDKEYLIQVPLYENVGAKSNVIKAEALGIAGVVRASVTDWMFESYVGTSLFSAKVDTESTDRPPYVDVTMIGSGSDIIKTLGVDVIASEERLSIEALDSASIIVSKAVAEKLNWGDDALGKYLYSYSGRKRRVVAVVEDFFSSSLKEELLPVVILNEPSPIQDNLLIRFIGENYNEALEQLRVTYERETDRPFEYNFFEDEINRLYDQEAGQLKLFNFFSVLAIVISLLGLLAMTAYKATARRREISIRKVLGASVTQLVTIINREFIVLFTISSLLAFPLAYFFVQDWLSAFVYRIEISPMIFVASFLAVFLLAVFVASLQSLRVCKENPAETLKEE